MSTIYKIKRDDGKFFNKAFGGEVEFTDKEFAAWYCVDKRVAQTFINFYGLRDCKIIEIKENDTKCLI